MKTNYIELIKKLITIKHLEIRKNIIVENENIKYNIKL